MGSKNLLALITISIMKLLELPPNYIELGSGQVVLATDMEGDPRPGKFIGWKPARQEIINTAFCKCWGIQVIRATL